MSWRTSLLGAWILGMTGCAQPSDEIPIERHELVGWGGGAELLTRTSSKGVLFAPGARYGPSIENMEWAEAYRFDPTADRLEPVSRAEWEEASGPVVNCVEACAGTAPWLKDGKLVVDGRTIALPAEVRRACLDPSARTLSVVLGRGRHYRAPGILPTFGGPRLHGLREHVFVRLEDGTILGEVRRVGYGDRDPELCWTPDGAYAVVYSMGFDEVILIEAPKKADAAAEE